MGRHENMYKTMKFDNGREKRHTNWWVDCLRPCILGSLPLHPEALPKWNSPFLILPPPVQHQQHKMHFKGYKESIDEATK